MSHLSWEDLVAYFSGDHEREAELEEHLMACDACAKEAARVAAITENLRALIPPVIDRAILDRLQAKGVRTRDTHVSPGERIDAEFPAEVDLLIHHLGGLDLSSAERVEVSVHVESSGRQLVHLSRAAFDRDAGEVLVACQRHFAVMPPDTVMEVAVHGPLGEQRRRYVIMHHFR